MKTSNHVIFDYNKITDFIYLGTNTCCQIHFQQELLDKGVRSDISLEGERLDDPTGVNSYLWLPTIDHTAPSLESLILGVQMLHTLEKEKTIAYVHCKNGHGRAPTLVAAFFISKGMSVKKSIRRIARNREEIHIEPIQEAMLERFAKVVKW